MSQLDLKKRKGELQTIDPNKKIQTKMHPGWKSGRLGLKKLLLIKDSRFVKNIMGCPIFGFYKNFISNVFPGGFS